VTWPGALGLFLKKARQIWGVQFHIQPFRQWLVFYESEIYQNCFSLSALIFNPRQAWTGIGEKYNLLIFLCCYNLEIKTGKLWLVLEGKEKYLSFQRCRWPFSLLDIGSPLQRLL
jgi:hypothetical protein